MPSNALLTRIGYLEAAPQLIGWCENPKRLRVRELTLQQLSLELGIGRQIADVSFHFFLRGVINFFSCSLCLFAPALRFSRHMEDQTLIPDDNKEHFSPPETTVIASLTESLISSNDLQSDAQHIQSETLDFDDIQSDTTNSDAQNSDLCQSDSESPSQPASHVGGENEVKMEAAEKLVPPSGSQDFIVISHHPKPPSVVIQCE